MSPAQTRLTIALLTALAASACSQPRTQVMVVIEADATVRAQTEALVVEVSGGPSYDALSQVADHRLDEPPRWPLRLPIIPADDDASRVFRVEARALDASGAVMVTGRRESGFVAGRTRALTIFLEAACRGVSCDSTQSCRAGACVDARVDPADLEPYDPEQPPSDAGRPTGEEDAGAIDAGAIDAGAVDAAPSDGGAIDAGPADAAPSDAAADAAPSDAGPPDAGAVCGDAVVQGSEVCDDGAENGTYGRCAEGCSGPGPRCGDGVVQPDFEECDDTDPTVCDPSTCTFPQVCGDGRVARGEVCYRPPSGLPVGLPVGLEMAAADLDGDGLDDLAITDGARTHLLHNNGDRFAWPLLADLPGTDEMIASGYDPDSDGAAAILFAGIDLCGTRCLELGDAEGGTYQTTIQLDLQIRRPYFAVAAGHLNSDSLPDVALGNFEGRLETVSFSAGGTLDVLTLLSSEIVALALPPTGTSDRGIAVASRAGQIAYFDLLDSGRIDTQRWTAGFPPDSIGSVRYFLDFADLDQDGTDELVGTGGQNAETRVWNVTTGDLLATHPWPWSTSGAAGHAILDLDRDGDLDLFVASYDGEYVIATRDGTGGFDLAEAGGLGCRALATATGDFNDDGVADFAIGTECGSVQLILSDP